MFEVSRLLNNKEGVTRLIQIRYQALKRLNMQQSFSKKELKDFLSKALTRTYCSRHKNALPLDEAIQVLTETSEKAGWETDTVLKLHMADVKNEDIRQLFRRFLIAKKYNVRPFDMTQQGAPPAIVYASDDCVLINMRNHVTTTRVLSPSGEILIPEGEVIIFPNEGFVAKNVNTLKMGMYSRFGKEILPCVFDNVTRKGELSYKGVSFDLVMTDLAIKAISNKIRQGRAIKFIYGSDQIAGISISHEQGAEEILDSGVRRIVFDGVQTDDGICKSVLTELKGIIGKTHRVFDADETDG